MQLFDELMEVARRLNGPGGCPWDLKQTFSSLQPYVLEEAYELVQAVDDAVEEEIIEELGDLLYVVIFYAKVAEKEGRFSFEEIVKCITEKLIRRHPHVFGEILSITEEEVVRNWEKIKKEEKKERKSKLDGIPEQLPLLVKAQKMIRAFERLSYLTLSTEPIASEEEIASDLFALAKKAERSGVDLESAFRRHLAEQGRQFQQFERAFS